MDTPELRRRLERMSTSQIKALAKSAHVSERALWYIKSGKTATASEHIRDPVKGKFPRIRQQKEGT